MSPEHTTSGSLTEFNHQMSSDSHEDPLVWTATTLSINMLGGLTESRGRRTNDVNDAHKDKSSTDSSGV